MKSLEMLEKIEHTKEKYGCTKELELDKENCMFGIKHVMVEKDSDLAWFFIEGIAGFTYLCVPKHTIEQINQFVNGE